MDYKGVKQSEKNILMKVTSRERPDKLLTTVSQYISKARNPSKMVWLFSFDEGDVCSTKEFRDKISLLVWQSCKSFDNIHVVVSGSENKIHAINRDVEKVQGWDILLNISDDQIPEVNGYDDIIRNTMPDNLDASLWFFDGCQPRINTQEIIGRVYFERTNLIYNPIYKSFYCDNEATEVASRLGKLIQSSQCIIRHCHPAVVKSVPTDDLYRRNDSYWQQDQDTFNQRVAVQFT